MSKPENPRVDLASDRNPYAFPAQGPDDEYNGITLRDYFAAKALAGFFSQPDTPLPAGTTIEEVREQACASWYAWADAMLAERSKS